MTQHVATRIAAGIALAALAPACSSVAVPPEFADEYLNSPQISVAAMNALGSDTPSRSKFTAGAAKVDLQVWALWSGDGDLPKPGQTSDSVGEIYVQWFFSGENSLESMRNSDPKMTRIDFPNTGEASGAPVGYETFTIHPGESPIRVVVRVFDQDEIGDSAYKESKNFAKKVSATASNIYPKNETVIPVLQDAFELLFLDLPNLFLKNDVIGTASHEFYRTATSVEVGTWTVKNQAIVLKVTVTAKAP